MKTILTTDAFDLWFDQLRDKQAKARIKARLRRAENGNFGDIKPVGEVISEEFVLLLAGGDKSTQVNDIQSALALARKLKEEK